MKTFRGSLLVTLLILGAHLLRADTSPGKTMDIPSLHVELGQPLLGVLKKLKSTGDIHKEELRSIDNVSSSSRTVSRGQVSSVELVRTLTAKVSLAAAPAAAINAEARSVGKLKSEDEVKEINRSTAEARLKTIEKETRDDISTVDQNAGYMTAELRIYNGSPYGVTLSDLSLGLIDPSLPIEEQLLFTKDLMKSHLDPPGTPVGEDGVLTLRLRRSQELVKRIWIKELDRNNTERWAATSAVLQAILTFSVTRATSNEPFEYERLLEEAAESAIEVTIRDRRGLTQYVYVKTDDVGLPLGTVLRAVGASAAKVSGSTPYLARFRNQSSGATPADLADLKLAALRPAEGAWILSNPCEDKEASDAAEMEQCAIKPGTPLFLAYVTREDYVLSQMRVYPLRGFRLPIRDVDAKRCGADFGGKAWPVDALVWSAPSEPTIDHTPLGVRTVKRQPSFNRLSLGTFHEGEILRLRIQGRALPMTTGTDLPGNLGIVFPYRFGCFPCWVLSQESFKDLPPLASGPPNLFLIVNGHRISVDAATEKSVFEPLVDRDVEGKWLRVDVKFSKALLGGRDSADATLVLERVQSTIRVGCRYEPSQNNNECAAGISDLEIAQFAQVAAAAGYPYHDLKTTDEREYAVIPSVINVTGPRAFQKGDLPAPQVDGLSVVDTANKFLGLLDAGETDLLAPMCVPASECSPLALVEGRLLAREVAERRYMGYADESGAADGAPGLVRLFVRTRFQDGDEVTEVVRMSPMTGLVDSWTMEDRVSFSP